MSVIGTYVRLQADRLDDLRKDSDWLTSVYRRSLPGVEAIDIDKACDGLACLLRRVPQASVPPVEGSGFVIRRSLVPSFRARAVERSRSLRRGTGRQSSFRRMTCASSATGSQRSARLSCVLSTSRKR